jgi:hypothetical protein
MATPYLRKKKLQSRVGFEFESKRNSTPAPSARSPAYPEAPSASSVPNSAPEPSTFDDFTFEDYKAAKLNIDQQYDLIGKLNNEVPLVDRDEIHSMLLADLAKQLEIGVFPTCKMMHVDPKAVKRMMDDQFRKAYGLAVEEEIFELAQARRMVSVRHASTVDVGDVANARESIADGDHSESTAAAALFVEPAKKKIKTTQPSAAHKVVMDGTAVADAIARMLSDVGNHSKNAVEAPSPAQPEKKKIALSQPKKAHKFAQTDITFAGTSAWGPGVLGEHPQPNVEVTPRDKPANKKTRQVQLSASQKEIKAYEARRKRAKGGCFILTLRAKAVTDKWAALSTNR